MPVRAPQAVPQREVLAVVVVKEEVVVGVVGGAVDDAGQSGGHAVVAVVDRNGPDVDENVEEQVEELVEGEEEGVEVVGEALQEAVHWMEGVAGEGGGDLPNMVWFVKQLMDTTNTSSPQADLDSQKCENQNLTLIHRVQQTLDLLPDPGRPVETQPTSPALV